MEVDPTAPDQSPAPEPSAPATPPRTEVLFGFDGWRIAGAAHLLNAVEVLTA